MKTVEEGLLSLTPTQHRVNSAPRCSGHAGDMTDPMLPSLPGRGVRFAGYAAVFDRADRGGDVVRAGAFGTPGVVPLLWQHGGAPVGVIESVGEDARGLRVIRRVENARLAGLVKAGAVSGLSFGYRVTAARGGRLRELTGVELVEVSLVAQPMQPLARVHAVQAVAP